MSKNFLLLNLDEPEAKEIHEVLSNKTSKRIIKHLTDIEHDTESGIAKALKLPLSTVHYNVQKLKKSRLVIVDTFHYSKKGREVDHYKLANKYIIITPKPVSDIKALLKSLIPIGIITAGVGSIVELVYRFGRSSQVMVASVAPQAMNRASDTIVQESEIATSAAAKATTQTLLSPEPAMTMLAEPTTSVFNISIQATWFFIGAVVAIIVMTLVLWLVKRKKSNHVF